EHLQNTVLDVERIEMLLAHEIEIRARGSAGRRPGVAACDQRRGAWIGRGADIGRTQMAAIGAQMLLPALRQERIEVAVRMDARMHVAIDDAQPALSGGFLGENGAVDDVTHAILLRYSNSMRRVSAAERSLTGCRHTCARRCWQEDAGASDRRRRTASADSPTQTETSCRSRS